MSTSASATVMLDHDISINGQRYPAGKQDVPTEVADDLQRMNARYNQSMRDLNVKHTHLHDSGNIAMGSGAE